MPCSRPEGSVASKQSLCALVAGAAIAVLALLPGTASADTTWSKISSDFSSSIAVPTVGILGTTAVVTWEQDTGPQTADLVSDTFQTSPAHDIANGVAAKIVTGWVTVDYKHGLAATPAGGLEIVFNGAHSTDSADPLRGMIAASHNADGTWTAAAPVGSGDGLGASTGILSGSVPIFAGNGSGSISVWVNPSSPASVRATDLQAQLGSGGDGYAPKLARDASGRI